PVAVLEGDVGEHGGPSPDSRFCGPGGAGQLSEERGGDVEFDDPAAWPGGGEPAGAVAGGAVDEQPAVGVGDGEAPFGAALLGDDRAGVARGDRAEAGDLARLLVVAEQGGQGDPHLDPDALVEAGGGGASS